MNELREDLIKYLLEYYTEKELEKTSTEILYIIKNTLERNLL